MKITPPVFLTIMTFLLLQGFSVSSWAKSTTLTYQGRIVTSQNVPLEHSAVSFLFQILDPSGACLIYQEQITGINMKGSNGVFDVPIGNGSVQFPLAGGVNVVDVFNNTLTYTCGACSSSGSIYTCGNSSSIYSSSMTDGRRLRVSFYDGSGWQTITPDNIIRSVPYAAFAQSAQKLGGNSASDFLLKAGLPTCAANTFLSWNAGTGAMTCAPVAGVSGGTVTSVTAGTGLGGGSITSSGTISLLDTSVSAGSYGSATQVATFTVDAQGRLTAAGNSIISGVTPGGPASGDLSGNFPNPTVSSLAGKALSIANPGVGHVLRFDGSGWANATLTTSDISGLNTTLANYLTQAAFNGYVASAGCASDQTMYWSSLTGSFQCAAINLGLAGDVAGEVTSSKVVALQNQPVDSAVPTLNQVLQWNGVKWVPTSLPAGNSGTVTSVTAGVGLSGGTITGSGTLSLSDTTVVSGGYGSATQIPSFTVNAQGQLTAAGNIPLAPAWSSVTGKPTTLAGYGIGDAIKNGGGVGGISSGIDGAPPASPSNGDLFVATDTKRIYRYNGASWDLMSSASGSGGTITALTSDVSASGTGAVVAIVNSVGGSSAAYIHSAELAANAATNSNTASTIVKRDASGNFAAGTITANLSGAASANVLKSGDLMSGNLIHAALTGNVYTAGVGGNTVTVQGPTGAVGTSYILRLPANAASLNGQVLTSDTFGNLNWTTPSTVATSYSGVLPVANGGTNSAAALNNNRIMVSASGAIVESAALTNGQILIGSTGAAPQAATLSAGSGVTIANSAGGITISATGTGGTVTNVSGVAPLSVATGASTPAISLANGSVAGQVFRWDGASAWSATKLKYTDVVNSLSTSPWPSTSCSSGQAVTWSSISDGFSCTNLIAGISGSSNLESAKVWVGDSANKAQEVSLSGDATLSNAGVLSLASVGAAGAYKSVTVDAKGRVVAGANPTTLSGFGIIDGMANLGGSPGIQTGLDASRPASALTGAIYFSTDAQKIYQYNSGAWTTIATANGAGGTVSSLSVATANGLAGSVATASTTPVITLSTNVTGLVKGNGAAFLAAGAADITTALGYTPVNTAGDSLSGNLTYAAGIGSLYTAGSGANTVKIQGPAGAIGTSYVLRLPSGVAAANGQVLTSDTSGNLTWTTLSTTATAYSGVLPVANGGTGTATGSITGTGALTFAAGGSNQNVTLTPSGTGYTLLSGNVGIGTATPTAKLEVAGNVNTIVRSTGTNFGSFAAAAGGVVAMLQGDGVNGLGLLGTQSNHAIGLVTGNTRRLTIDTSGRVGIGTTSPGYTLDVTGTMRVTDQAYTTTGNGSFSILSDIRYKDIHGSYDRGLAEILKLEIIKFSYKKDNPLGSDSSREYVGVSAQNLQASVPEAVEVRKENGGEYLTVNTSPVLWVLLNAVKQFYYQVMDRFTEQDRQMASIADLKADRSEVEVLRHKVEKIDELEQEIAKKNQEIELLTAYLCQKDPAAPLCK